jgi:cell wall assembly regulator SMI1
MQTILQQVDTLLRIHRPDYYARLQPGASASELDALELALGLQLLPDYRTLYTWKNGQRGFKTLHHNLTFMSLKQAQEAHTILTGLLRGGEFSRANWWHPAWIPFLDNGGGNHYCLDLAGSFTGRVGQIIEFRHDHPARTILAPSLSAWLADYATLLATTDWEEMIGDLYLDWIPRTPGYPIAMQAG